MFDSMFPDIPAPVHPYANISLAVAGYILGGMLILGHLVALFSPQPVQAFLKKAPRNESLGQITLAVALFWFFLLIAPEGDSFLSYLRMDFGGFQNMVPWLRILVPVFFFLMIFKVKEFLFVRALGILGLLVVAPFLTAAYLQEPVTRLLIPVWCFAVVGMSLFWIGKPYLLRDQVAWITATPGRWNALSWVGIIYGAAILACDCLFW